MYIYVFMNGICLFSVYNNIHAYRFYIIHDYSYYKHKHVKILCTIIYSNHHIHNHGDMICIYRYNLIGIRSLVIMLHLCSSFYSSFRCIYNRANHMTDNLLRSYKGKNVHLYFYNSIFINVYRKYRYAFQLYNPLFTLNQGKYTNGTSIYI